MEQYSYYPAQTGHPPSNVANQQQQQQPQHGGLQMQQQQQQQPTQGGQIIQSPMPAQNIRQATPPGPPNHHHQHHHLHQQQQIHHQPSQHLVHHPPQQQQQQQQQQMNHQQQQQQQHPNYHMQPHPHVPTMPHSSSPHPQQQHLHHNQQLTMAGPPQQQQAISSHQHHLHSQSPHHHHNGPLQLHIQHQQHHPHLHQQQQQQHHHHQLNHMVRPPMGPSIMSHPNQGIQQHQHQNHFYNGGPGGSVPQQTLHHYPQQNQHQHQQLHHHHHQQQQHQQQLHQHQPTMMHHHPPAHQIHLQQNVGRNSPHRPSILPSEFRIIELNRRLQCRPIPRHEVSPLPSGNPEECQWWERFASDFFEDDATLILRSIQDDKPVEYKIGRTLIPRYFKTYFDGGVTDLSVNLKNPKEVYLQPQSITLDCDQASIVTNNIFRHPALQPMSHGIVVHTDGHLILDFVTNNYDKPLLIKSWRFYTKNCREYIDRSVTAMGIPTAQLVDPVTRQQGLTKSTITYLKMCMIMEPMQDLMFLHRQTKSSPKECLYKILVDKYKYKGEDSKATKRRGKRNKPAAITGVQNTNMSGPTQNKKSRTSISNPMGNNVGQNNNMIMSPSGPVGFSLTSQDVMVVGEPSMMGGDFGDDNERMITRLENTQYDPNVSMSSNVEELDSLNASTGNDNSLGNNIELSLDNDALSPSILQQRKLIQLPIIPEPDQNVQPSPNEEILNQPDQIQKIQMNIQEQDESSQSNSHNLIEDATDDIISQQIVQQPDMEQMQQNLSKSTSNEEILHEVIKIEPKESPEQKHQDQLQQPIEEGINEEKVNSLVEPTCDSDLMLGINSVEQIENYVHDSIQPLNEESNSNSQLPCASASASSAIEQQQPVDNGVA